MSKIYILKIISCLENAIINDIILGETFKLSIFDIQRNNDRFSQKLVPIA